MTAPTVTAAGTNMEGAGSPGTLWALVGTARDLHRTWETTRLEADRVTMRAAWDIHGTCPDARPGNDTRLDNDTVTAGTRPTCTPTVLAHDTGRDDNHMAFRGACLGCGWVSSDVHLLWDLGENGAAEDAHDHTHPGWRNLPVVARPPTNQGAPSYRRALTAWRARWETLLPDRWLERGGPIRTQRNGIGTRHVPGRAPGGGYDMSADDTAPEAPGGQLGLF